LLSNALAIQLQGALVRMSTSQHTRFWVNARDCHAHWRGRAAAHAQQTTSDSEGLQAQHSVTKYKHAGCQVPATCAVRWGITSTTAQCACALYLPAVLGLGPPGASQRCACTSYAHHTWSCTPASATLHASVLQQPQHMPHKGGCTPIEHSSNTHMPPWRRVMRLCAHMQHGVPTNQAHV
jgi:hypothetical protein